MAIDLRSKRLKLFLFGIVLCGILAYGMAALGIVSKRVVSLGWMIVIVPILFYIGYRKYRGN